MIQPAAGIVVWLGASLVVVADGRRGLAAGIALSTLGLAVLAWVTTGPVAAAAVAAGGAIAAARRSVSGPAGWEILAPGSTPRLVLCIATALVAFWIADAVTAGSVASLRFGLMTGIALAAARVLSTAEPAAQLSAVAIVALCAASVGAIGSTEPGVWPYVAGGLVAALLGWLPMRRPSAA
ncbi:MAG TPA: hypothetical protein VGX22_06240 [Candidatus Dormibacteraeota bacterium]|nr:hypothetical protein [Candidatus Dormibacteraeota bacterium]